MATQAQVQTQPVRTTLNLPRLSLQLNALYEAVIGTAALLGSASLAQILNMDVGLAQAYGIGTLVYAAVLYYFSTQTPIKRRILLFVALVNLIFAIDVGALMAVNVLQVAQSSQMLVIAALDVFVVLGVVQLVLWWRGRS